MWRRRLDLTLKPLLQLDSAHTKDFSAEMGFLIILTLGRMKENLTLLLMRPLMDQHAGIRWERFLANAARLLALTLLRLSHAASAKWKCDEISLISLNYSKSLLFHQNTVRHGQFSFRVSALDVPNPIGGGGEVNVLAEVARQNVYVLRVFFLLEVERRKKLVRNVRFHFKFYLTRNDWNST